MSSSGIPLDESLKRESRNRFNIADETENNITNDIEQVWDSDDDYMCNIDHSFDYAPTNNVPVPNHDQSLSTLSFSGALTSTQNSNFFTRENLGQSSSSTRVESNVLRVSSSNNTNFASRHPNPNPKLTKKLNLQHLNGGSTSASSVQKLNQVNQLKYYPHGNGRLSAPAPDANIQFRSEIQQSNSYQEPHKLQPTPPQPPPKTEPPPKATKPSKPWMRIKVEVEGKTLLIPLVEEDGDRDIWWLARQVGERYFSVYLHRPVLHLSTLHDDILLCPGDPISAVVSDQDHLKATVTDWDQPTVHERYVKGCQAFCTEPHAGVSSCLRESEASGCLRLNDLGLGQHQLQPVYRALQGETTLTQLSLAGNRLGDAGVVPLVEVLQVMVMC